MKKTLLMFVLLFLCVIKINASEMKCDYAFKASICSGYNEFEANTTFSFSYVYKYGDSSNNVNLNNLIKASGSGQIKVDDGANKVTQTDFKTYVNSKSCPSLKITCKLTSKNYSIYTINEIKIGSGVNGTLDSANSKFDDIENPNSTSKTLYTCYYKTNSSYGDVVLKWDNANNKAAAAGSSVVNNMLQFVGFKKSDFEEQCPKINATADCNHNMIIEAIAVGPSGDIAAYKYLNPNTNKEVQLSSSTKSITCENSDASSVDVVDSVTEKINESTSVNIDSANLDVSSTPMTCNELLGNNLTNIVKFAIILLRVAGAVIAIVNAMIELVPAVMSKDADALQKSKSKCIGMGILLAVILVFPSILRFIGDVLGFDISCLV